MKFKSTKKRLGLNKMTVATLDQIAMFGLRGGVDGHQNKPCTYTCIGCKNHHIEEHSIEGTCVPYLP